MTERTSIFTTPTVDVSDFKPKPASQRGPDPSEIDRVTNVRFRSRELTREPEVSNQSIKRPPMVYRTGRNVTFSAKTTRETVEAFYEIAQRNGWKAGETFEKAVEALASTLAKREGE